VKWTLPSLEAKILPWSIDCK